MISPAGSSPLKDLITKHQSFLRAVCRDEGARVRRFESADDVLQGFQVHLLTSSPGFEDQGEPAFKGFIRTSVRNYVINRYKYWTAKCRHASGILRLAQSTGPRIEPAASGPRNSRFAHLKEQYCILVKALDVLPDKDLDLISSLCKEEPLAELAERRGSSEDAARKARERALENLKQTVRLVETGQQFGS